MEWLPHFLASLEKSIVFKPRCVCTSDSSINFNSHIVSAVLALNAILKKMCGTTDMFPAMQSLHLGTCQNAFFFCGGVKWKGRWVVPGRVTGRGLAHSGA